MRSRKSFTRCGLSALFVVALLAAANGFFPSRLVEASEGTSTFVPETVTAAPVDTLEQALIREAPDLDPEVLDLALQSQANAIEQGLVGDPSVLTVIDYSRPSVEPRLFVFDLDEKKLVFEELVAHGKNSGDNIATEFSNAESSHKTSLGLFVTRDTYVGKHGESLRLEGLEPGFNDRARERAIVIHGADYVNTTTAAKLGRLGRSHGCPALSRDAAGRVIERIRGGSAVFAYYPDETWLEGSRFLGPETTDPAPVAALEPVASL